MILLAIDPGPVESAYVAWSNGEITRKGKALNDDILEIVKEFASAYCPCVIEKLACYGMIVGAEVLETAFWSGRFAQASCRRFYRLTRLEVKMHLCHDSRAKDANVRQAIIDRFGGPSAIRAAQKAKLRKGIAAIPAGPLFGVRHDEWAALAVALTWWDQNPGALA